jgi:hypothetical protein
LLLPGLHKQVSDCYRGCFVYCRKVCCDSTFSHHGCPNEDYIFDDRVQASVESMITFSLFEVKPRTFEQSIENGTAAVRMHGFFDSTSPSPTLTSTKTEIIYYLLRTDKMLHHVKMWRSRRSPRRFIVNDSECKELIHALLIERASRMRVFATTQAFELRLRSL